MGKPINVSDQDFEELVLGEKDKPVLVDFWAVWCGPCIMMGPVLDELANDYDGKAVIAKLDVDKSPSTASKYSVRSIPTLIFFKNGEVVDKVVGAARKQDIAKRLDQLS